MKQGFSTQFSAVLAAARQGLLILFAVSMLNACGTKSAPSGPQQPELPDSKPTDESTSASQALKFEQGNTALAAGNHAQARRIFGEIIRANPTLSGPYANLALIEFKQKNYQAAFKQVNKALELNPTQAQAYHLRAQIRLQQGEIKMARDDYQQALELNPEYLNAHYNLALLYDIYLQEIALAIDHYSIYLSLLGDRDEAIEEWINHLKGTLNNG